MKTMFLIIQVSGHCAGDASPASLERPPSEVKLGDSPRLEDTKDIGKNYTPPTHFKISGLYWRSVRGSSTPTDGLGERS